ncbi:alpha/beta fold hydrolase [Streptomyces sp. NPDC059637]
MRLRSRVPRRLFAAAASAAVLAAGPGGLPSAAAAPQAREAGREDVVLSVPESRGSGKKVRIDASFFTSDASGVSGRRPAVLLAHGFGGSKESVREQAVELADRGYAVLTWSARGFGASGGRIGLNSPDREVEDVKHLLDWLAERPEVELDREGDPRAGVAGASYGGAVALLAAAHDDRVDAIAPQMTWWNLADALFPQRGSGAGDTGVFKKLWSGIFFTTGSASAGAQPPQDAGSGGGGPAPGGGDGAPARGPAAQGSAARGSAAQGPAGRGPKTQSGGADRADRAGGADGCGRFLPDLCAMYDRVAVAGKPDAEAVELLERSSPSSVADRIRVPALIMQGQGDSLFTLDQADAMARAVRDNGAPVAVDWFAGGHDGGDQEAARLRERTAVWFDRHLKQDRGVDTGPGFRVSRTGGVDSTNGRGVLRAATAARYPGLDGTDVRTVALEGGAQEVSNPPGGSPPAISSLPGLGSLSGGSGLSGLSGLGVGLSLDFPGQYARFDSEPLTEAVRVTGSPRVSLTVESDSPDAVLFAKLYDVGPDGRGQVLPQQLVSPLRVTDADREGGRTVRVSLPAVDHQVQAGHRLRLVVATTDLAYASPVGRAAHRISLADGAASVTVPSVPALRVAQEGLPWWVWGMPLGAVAVAAALLLTGRRSGAAGLRAPAPDPESAGVPLVIEGLTKRYARADDRYAVRDLSFRVERGQVLGLLGPNGAGKTTTLRMLMGLIRPDGGEIRVFGHAVRPGSPVLSRVGAFVEGSGFLPHLTGRANLDLYWRATGRPVQDAHLEEALEIAGLGEALDRAVRTYSQGMRQRLAIAQAMLGLPDLLILDEPTNGLDPPQIREMREVLIRYADTGRTVIVSSHLLAEVEQSCTHLVVMDRGRLVAAGPVAEIVGEGDTLFVGVPGAGRAEGPGGAGGWLEAALDKVADLPGVASVARTDDGLLVRLDGATAADLVAELVRAGVPVDRVGPHRRLEEAFLTLIGGTA